MLFPLQGSPCSLHVEKRYSAFYRLEPFPQTLYVKSKVFLLRGKSLPLSHYQLNDLPTNCIMLIWLWRSLITGFRVFVKKFTAEEREENNNKSYSYYFQTVKGFTHRQISSFRCSWDIVSQLEPTWRSTFSKTALKKSSKRMVNADDWVHVNIMHSEYNLPTNFIIFVSLYQRRSRLIHLDYFTGYQNIIL